MKCAWDDCYIMNYAIQRGKTPLHYAAQKNSKGLELLLSHGAKLNIKDNVSNMNG